MAVERNYFDRAAYAVQIPREGSKSVRIIVPFDDDNSSFELNALLTQGLRFMSLIAGFFCDNSQNPQSITFNSAIINQSLAVPAFSQAYLSLFVPKNGVITFLSTGAVPVPVDLLNVPVPSAVWSI